MSADLALPLAAIFISVALGRRLAGVDGRSARTLAGTAAAAAERRPADRAGQTGLVRSALRLLEPAKSQTRAVEDAEGTSTKVSRQQRRMELAGWTDPEAAGYFALAEMVVPIICRLAAAGSDGHRGVAARDHRGRARLSRAGCRADARDPSPSEGHPERPAGRHRPDRRVRRGRAPASIRPSCGRAKSSSIVLPALARELRTVTNEIRAGKPRIEAFQGLAKRTQVEDVRALVSMLTQTDRFGTSIAQALRTHAVDVANQAAAARGRARRQSGRQAGLSARPVPGAGALCRVSGSSRYQNPAGVDVAGRSGPSPVEFVSLGGSTVDSTTLILLVFSRSSSWRTRPAPLAVCAAKTRRGSADTSNLGFRERRCRAQFCGPSRTGRST